MSDTEVYAAENEAPDEGQLIGKEYREKYGKEKHCGDDVAVVLKEHCLGKDKKLDVAKLEKVAKKNGIDFSKYEGLNSGMQRMNVGNILRGMIKRGEKVVVGDQVWEAQEPEKTES